NTKREKARRILLNFGHGLGDAVQFGIVARALREHDPLSEVYVACGYGKHSVFANGDPMVKTLIDGSDDVDHRQFDDVREIRWPEPDRTYDGAPSTKAARHLLEIGVPLDSVDFHYSIPPNDADAERADEYLRKLPSPAVAIHYQANTRGGKKDLPHDLVLDLCRSLLDGGLTPLILDWDERCPFVDNSSIFCPDKRNPLWRNREIGDASLIRYLIEGSVCMLGVDSGPVHVAGATTTPTIAVWKCLHPVQFYDIADNVLHLIPRNHEELIRGEREPGLAYFQDAYRSKCYRSLGRDLKEALWGLICSVSDSNGEKSSQDKLELGRCYHEYNKARGFNAFAKGNWQRCYAEMMDSVFGIRGKRILDVGCAAGSLTCAFQELGADAWGVDVCQYFIQNSPFEGLRDRLTTAPAWKLPFEDCEFDFLHCSQVLEHIPEDRQEEVFRELLRVTRADGLIFAATPMRESDQDVEWDDVTHICVRPRAFWVQKASEVRLDDVTDSYRSIEDHEMYKEYKWDYVVWRRPIPSRQIDAPQSRHPSGKMRWLVAHWGDNKRHVFDPVVHSLEQLGHECEWIARDDMEVRPKLIAAIKSNELDGLLTWQRFYPMQHDVLQALQESTLQTVYMDYGFAPHYESVVFDSKGENATSQLRRSWPNNPVQAAGEGNEATVDAFLKEQEAKKHMLPREFPELRDLFYPFVFVPLQRPTDSVVKYDSTAHDFGRLVRRVLLLAAHRLFVVIKTHPLDADLDLGIPDRVAGRHVVLRRSFGDQNEELCDFLLSEAALVTGINSNMLFRALLFGKPVIACGEGWFSGSGALQEVNGIDGLTSLECGPIDRFARRRYIRACLDRQLVFTQLSDPKEIKRVFATIGIPLQRPHADHRMVLAGATE
ncbi:MAG: methyltransferase domain-containing protein, partial [Bacteroidota bacterium]